MAHYAYIDENNRVTQVIVGPEEGTEPEGFDSWEEYFSQQGKGRALRTSYNTMEGIHYDINTGEPSEDQSKAFRFNYAGIGMIYNEEFDAFITPQPFESWTLNISGLYWEPPVPRPEGEGSYVWNEESLSWLEN